MKLPIVVLVGGLGKRLGNKVKKNPKPLININGKPFLELVLNNLINKGFKEEVLKFNILNNFTGEVSRYEETEVLENKDAIIEGFINGSLFVEKKILII